VGGGCGLGGAEAVVERQQLMPPEEDDCRFRLAGSAVECGSFGPVRRSATELRRVHLAVTLQSMRLRLAGGLGHA
jgi:hypothetical protein